MIASHMANCLWNDNEDHHRWHLTNWGSISMCKQFGGLGIPDLRDLNLCLLGSWLKRYQLDSDKQWRKIIDSKYNTKNPNIFCSSTVGASQFFRGVMWAAKAAKMGYRWKIGDGRMIKFWEDNWLGNSSLAIQYWDLYVLVNEKNKTVHYLWDGSDLRCTFRRTVSDSLYRKWEEVVQLATTITLGDEQDEMIWSFNDRGVYSSQSLYKVINNRGVKPVHLPAIWNLKIPPRTHFFLWLLTKNKVLTRDNVAKRKSVEDDKCMFCNKKETVVHLFFECVVAKQLWANISEAIDIDCGRNFESIGNLWLSKKYTVSNMFTSAALWGLWKLRNYLCFQNGRWKDVSSMMRRIVGMVQNWELLCPEEKKPELKQKLTKLKSLAERPGRLAI